MPFPQGGKERPYRPRQRDTCRSPRHLWPDQHCSPTLVYAVLDVTEAAPKKNRAAANGFRFSLTWDGSHAAAAVIFRNRSFRRCSTGAAAGALARYAFLQPATRRRLSACLEQVAMSEAPRVTYITDVVKQ